MITKERVKERLPEGYDTARRPYKPALRGKLRCAGRTDEGGETRLVEEGRRNVNVKKETNKQTVTKLSAIMRCRPLGEQTFLVDYFVFLLTGNKSDSEGGDGERGNQSQTSWGTKDRERERNAIRRRRKQSRLSSSGRVF